MNPRIPIDRTKIADFCRKWKIRELALFGSVLREDFRPDSDIDVMVTFQKPIRWTLFDLAHMEQELEEILGRKVDLTDRTAVEQTRNYIRRRAILDSARTVYAAG